MKKLLLSIALACISHGIIAKNAANCPRGSYLSTCDECSVNNQVLTCKKCKDDKGNTHQSTLKHPCVVSPDFTCFSSRATAASDIYNDNGVLGCNVYCNER